MYQADRSGWDSFDITRSLKDRSSRVLLNLGEACMWALEYTYMYLLTMVGYAMTTYL